MRQGNSKVLLVVNVQGQAATRKQRAAGPWMIVVKGS
jgi:hypothetical protein